MANQWTEEELLDLARKYSFRSRMDRNAISGPVLVWGRGSVVRDVNGKEYLDFNSGQMCAALGHNHPRIVQALQESCETLIRSHMSLFNDKEIILASRMAEIAPPGMNRSMFLTSGSDSNEAAMAIAKRYTGGYEIAGEPVSLIRVRALMSPSGIPDFMTRTRLVEQGPVPITGRAWTGRRQVAGVEVSTDGGSTWDQASLYEPVSAFAWRQWSFQWDAKPGRYILLVRATDSQGNVQPVSQPWNFQGMGNNMAQRVAVLVE